MKASAFSLDVLFSVTVACGLSLFSASAQTPPVAPEDSGVTPKTDTIFINLPSIHNNTSTESLGVAIGQNGNVLVGWEDDGDGFTDTEAIWTMFNSSGGSITPDTLQTSIDPQYAGLSTSNKFLSYFRSNGSAIPGNTSWGPKIKANLFGDGFGMGATSFSLGVEVAEFGAINLDAGGGGDFPTVQLLTASGGPAGIVSGMTDADAEPAGDVRIADWHYLANGNVVIVGESRQDEDRNVRFGALADVGPDHVAVYRIVTPTGTQIKAYAPVSSAAERNEIWHGVGVTANGFAVRFNRGGAKVRLFDNAGNPTSDDIDLATLTTNAIAGGGGRGDGAGFHGNGKDAYVAVNSGVDAQGARQVWVTVLNANGTLRYSKAVTAGDLALSNADRVDAAIEADGRVLVVFDDAVVTGTRLVMGRMLDAAGNPLGRTFHVSEIETPTSNSLESRRPRVSWRGGLAAIVWESKNSPETQDSVVAMRLFSTFKPGSVESVGLTRIVADTPIIVPAAAALGNWEPYISVLGESTFLLEGNTFATNSDAEQRYVVALQPAAGGAMRLGEGFFSDNGQPYLDQINLSRQNGNPGRVAGDKRPGAVNFVTGGEASLYGFPAAFNSDGRADPNSPFYAALAGVSTGARYGSVQTFRLDPVTLVQTMLSKAFDSAFGRCCTNTVPPEAISDQISRFGGDLAGLDNGNFVSVVEDRSKLKNAGGNAAVATIFRPDGTIVTEAFKVADGDIWSNVAAYRGGFAVRVGGVIYFFDNAGALQGQVDQNTSGDSFDRGRGDGTRLFAHINSPYVYLVGKVTTATTVKVAVWDARTRAFVTLASVSEAGFPGDTDRANGAVDALNRLVVGWVSRPTGYVNQQVAARVLALNVTNNTITPLTGSFFPFVNAATNDTIRSLQMSLAMTTRQIAVAAKGEINLQNNPSAGANSPREVNFYTVFSHPDPQADTTAPAGVSGPNPIPVATSVGNPPALAGKGLDGRYWKRAPKSITTLLGSTGAVATVINTVPPTARFTATRINYTGNDLTPVETWLGTNATGLTVDSPGNLDDGLFSFIGWLAIKEPGQVQFSTPSDDGSVVTIGGVQVVNNDGSHGAPGNTPSGTATFTAPGLYPIEINYFNGDWLNDAGTEHGGANIQFTSNGRGGIGSTNAVVPTAVLYGSRDLRIVPSFTSAGPPPAQAGTGIDGRYWQRAPKSIITLLGPTGAVETVVKSVPPSATFLAKSINYTGNDLTPVATWLGTNATSLNPPTPGNLDDGLFTFNGWIAIKAPGPVQFSTPSDDGSVVNIGGVQVINNDGSHGAPGNTPSGTVTFEAAGLYPLEINYFNGDWLNDAGTEHGGASIQFTSNGRGGIGSTNGVVPTSVLYGGNDLKIVRRFASVGSPPPEPGTGLAGRYWKRDPKSITTLLGSTGAVETVIKRIPPMATFLATTINYTGNDLTPVETWLGTNATGLTPPSPGNLDDGLFSFTGFIAIKQPGRVQFSTPSDDGSVVNIGGVQVINNDGSHGAPGNTPSGTVTFQGAGLYPIEIHYFNGDWLNDAGTEHGGANIQFTSNGAGGIGSTNQVVPKVVLYPTSGDELAFVSISESAGAITITWIGGGRLQQADKVEGPYADVTGATSPHTVQASAAAQKFYRLVK